MNLTVNVVPLRWETVFEAMHEIFRAWSMSFQQTLTRCYLNEVLEHKPQENQAEQPQEPGPKFHHRSNQLGELDQNCRLLWAARTIPTESGSGVPQGSVSSKPRACRVHTGLLNQTLLASVD